MNVVQPAGMEGEVKLIGPITLEAVGDAVVAAGLATAEELSRRSRSWPRSPGRRARC
jgi:hypothetical protein